MMNERPKAVVIAGPTASGKSGLGVELAIATGGEIVNADSMQVYRGMDIGTAKPTPAERKNIPHHLMDVVNPDEGFNAAIYREMALPVIREITSRGNACFVVGGTGLYLKTLFGGLFECPPVDQGLRAGLHRECETRGSEALHERLKRRDPEYAAGIHPNDRVRIIRALEILHLTKTRPSELSRKHGFKNGACTVLKLYLEIEREVLYSRINRRAEHMIASGLVEETERLLAEGYSPELKPLRAIGYRHMVSHLKGNWSLEEALRQLKRDTRRYAKRQLTWFRGDAEGQWVARDDVPLILKRVKDFLYRAT